MKMRFWRKIFWTIGLFIFCEIVFRLIGFGELPIYQSATTYDYCLVPSQDVHRLGNRFYINKQGMRSEELQDGEFRIVKFGDSVLNGGIATDQSELASTIIENRLQNIHPSIRSLSVSAGSWGPDNAFEWMKEFGDFDAQIIVLVFSSHDWQDQIACVDVVGKVPFYPSHQPALAITDAGVWFYSRFVRDVSWSEIPYLNGCTPNEEAHNKGWDDFINHCESNDIPLIVYHHANKQEVIDGGWNEMGIRLEAYLSAHKVDAISGLDSKFNPEDFTDEIHPSPSGQTKIADAIYPSLSKLIGDGE